MNPINLTLLGILAITLLGASTGAARDDDSNHSFHGDRSRAEHDRGVVRAAYRVNAHYDRRGAFINHQLDAVAFIAAVTGDYPLARAIDRHGNRIEHRYDRYGDRIVHATKAAAHRHHDRCGHPRSSWQPVRHHGKHVHAKHGHGRGHGHGRTKAHGPGHRPHGKHKGHDGGHRHH